MCGYIDVVRVSATKKFFKLSFVNTVQSRETRNDCQTVNDHKKSTKMFITRQKSMRVKTNLFALFSHNFLALDLLIQSFLNFALLYFVNQRQHQTNSH